MRKLLIRHELSEANNRDNWGTEAFGHADASLMPLGAERAPRIGYILETQHGIDLSYAQVAVSAMRRTQETARYAGLQHAVVYPELNELSLTFDEIIEGKQRSTPPTRAIEQIQPLLDNPPHENIWFTHGFVIATICHVRGLAYDRFIPRFGEIRTIEFDD